MRSITVAALGISFATHVGLAAALFWPRHVPDAADRVDPAPQLAGVTFELPAPETADGPLANAAPSPDTQAVPAPEVGDAPARPVPPARAVSAARPSHQGRPSAGKASSGDPEGMVGGAGAGALFGAVGDRSAADLATAFTRGFPQAASGDPSWRQAALGPAGEATVTLTLDDEGHITDVQVSGAPSAALSAGIRRTMALIKGRPFVAKSKATKLLLSATISADSVHDGLHGAVFAIGGSFAASEGSAFFALAIGRRIDVRVRLR